MNASLKSCTVAVLICAPLMAFATTPTITGVSGTVGTGQVITITGTTMVDENRTGWDPFFTSKPTASGFEGTSPVADGYSTSCSGVAYDTSVKLMGQKSIRTRTSGASAYPNYGVCSYQFSPTANVADRYFRVYSRWNVSGGWPNEDNKYWWLGGGETQFFNLMPNGAAAPTQVGFYAPSVNGGNWIRASIPGGSIRNDRWYLIEMHLRRSGSPPYVVEVWIDNQLVISTTIATNGPAYNSWGWEANTNYWNTTANFVSNHWQDGFAISSQRIGGASIIEIGNSPDYTTAAKVYQPPVFLSDGSVQVTADLTGLGSGPYYLWVTNNRGERSQQYALGTGGGAASTPPPTTILPPQNLQVVP